MHLRAALLVGLFALLLAPAASAAKKKVPLDPIEGKNPGLGGAAAYRVAAYGSQGLFDFLNQPGNAAKAGAAAADYYDAIAPILEDRVLGAVLAAGSAEIQATAPTVVRDVLAASRSEIVGALGDGLDQVFSPANQGRTVDFVGSMTARVTQELSKNLDSHAGSLVRTVTAELSYQMAQTVIPGLQESMVQISPMLSEGSAAVTRGILATIVENTEQVKLISRYSTDGVVEGMSNGLWTHPPDEDGRLGVLGEAVSETLADTIKKSRQGIGEVALEATTVAATALIPVALLGIFMLSGLRMRHRHEEKMRAEDQDVIELRRRLKQAEARASEADARVERTHLLGVALDTLSGMAERASDAEKDRVNRAYATLVEGLPGYLRDPEADAPSELIEELRRALRGQG